jgi:DNA-directed RNA polymerase
MNSRSEWANINRHRRRNALTSGIDGRPRQYCATPVGKRVVTEHFIPPLSKFLRGDCDLKPEPPPRHLGNLIATLDYDQIAFCGVAPILNGYFRGWDRDDPSVFTKACEAVADHLVWYLKKTLAIDPLTDVNDRVRAGAWLLDCATTLSQFDIDEDGLPAIAKDWQPIIDGCERELLEDLMRRHPVLLAHPSEPLDWTGWRSHPEERLRITFVRDHSPETQQAIEIAFRNPDWEHPKAVNALQHVPLEVDPVIVDLVDQCAVKIMDHSDRQRRLDHQLVDADVAEATYWLGQPFWLSYNCDTRGRVYSAQHLNYGREDHARAMFRFHRGEPLGKDGLYWLQVHAANCHGETDKQPWNKRVCWALDNRPLIERIAADPKGTFNEWRDVEKPFAYVAACRELVQAWADPNFITHLPVGFDHTSSGYQHHAMIVRDEETARLVNLIDGDEPQDVYSVVIKQVLLDLEDPSELSPWWRDRLEDIGPRQTRKILKTPIMTYGYSVSVFGMAEQIADAYAGSNQPLPHGAAFFLAEKIRKAVEKLLPGPARVMRWARAIAQACSKEGRIVQWTSPTGFPCANRYNKPLFTTLNLRYGGQRHRPRVAYGSSPEIKKRKAIDSIAPNFVHSLDASHLVRIVNAAVEDGINDIVTVHDSFAVHAPRAVRLNHIIRRELAIMYQAYDALGTLQENCPSLIPPTLGDLDPLEVQNAEWLCI